MYVDLFQTLGALVGSCTLPVFIHFFVELVNFFESLATTNALWSASSSFYLLVVGAAI
jgi:hypothetical protein